MLAKLTSKNQITLPKAAVEAAIQSAGSAEYFEVAFRDGQIVLTPVRIQRGDAVRAKLAALGLSDGDVADAVRWSRTATIGSASPADAASGGKAGSRKKPARRA